MLGEPSIDETCQRRTCPSRLKLAAALAVVLLVCAVTRVWLIVHTEVIASDGTVYIQMAREWFDDPLGVVDSYDYHVTYPAMVASAHWVMSSLGGPGGIAGWDLSGQIVSLLFALAAVAGVWVFAGMTFNWRVAWMAALLFGVGRKWAVVGSDVLSDAPSVCFQVWAVVAGMGALKLLRRNNRRVLVAAAGVGLCTGCGYLIRPEALLAGVVVIVLWLAYLLAGQVKLRQTLAAAAVTAVTAAMCGIPYMLAIGGLTKKKRLTDVIPLSLRDGPGRILASIGISGDVGGLQKVVNQLFEAMHPLLGFLAIAWLATWVGLRILRLKLPAKVGVFPRAPGVVVMLTATAIITPIMMTLYSKVNYLSHRHMMFLAALLSPLAGAGALVLAGWVAMLLERSSRLAKRAVWALPAVTVVLLAGLLCHSLRPLHQGRRCFRQAGRFVNSAAGEEADFLITDNVWVSHYADTPRGVLLPTLERGEKLLEHKKLLEHIRQTSATYVVVATKKKAGPAAGGEEVIRPEWLELAQRFRQIHGADVRTAYVYRVDHDALGGMPSARSGIATTQPGR